MTAVQIIVMVKVMVFRTKLNTTWDYDFHTSYSRPWNDDFGELDIMAIGPWAESQLHLLSGFYDAMGERLNV